MCLLLYFFIHTKVYVRLDEQTSIIWTFWKQRQGYEFCLNKNKNDDKRPQASTGEKSLLTSFLSGRRLSVLTGNGSRTQKNQVLPIPKTALLPRPLHLHAKNISQSSHCVKLLCPKPKAVVNNHNH